MRRLEITYPASAKDIVRDSLAWRPTTPVELNLVIQASEEELIKVSSRKILTDHTRNQFRLLHRHILGICKIGSSVIFIQIGNAISIQVATSISGVKRVQTVGKFHTIRYAIAVCVRASRVRTKSELICCCQEIIVPVRCGVCRIRGTQAMKLFPIVIEAVLIIIKWRIGRIERQEIGRASCRERV